MNIEEFKLILISNSLGDIESALKDFDLASFDNNGNNILHYFIKSDASQQIQAETILQLFVDAGIDINTRQTKIPKRTALHLAVIKKLKHVFDTLLRNGADITVQDGNGNTALSEAVMGYMGDNGYFIETLISKGARVDVENNYGVSPKSLAETIANYDTRKFFL